MIYNVTLNDYGKVSKSCIIYISIINHNTHKKYRHYWCIFYVYWHKKKNISVENINLPATYVDLLYYNKIDVSEGIDINKSNKSKECMICNY